MDAPTLRQTDPADQAKNREKTGQFLSSASRLPISFTYDGAKIIGIPKDWKPSDLRRRLDATIVEMIFEGREPETGLALRIDCMEYADFPVGAWTAWLTNTGVRPTPIIEQICAMDGTVGGASPVLWHCNGDYYSGEGYAAQEAPLRGGEAPVFAPAGGRPCDRAFPYYRIAFAGWGLSIAIGWPGQWSASFAGTAGGVHVKAGQERTHLRLMPGEAIRMPRMTVMSWAGDPARAADLWRRWYRVHLLTRSNGQPLRPRLAGHGTDEGAEFTAATEENQIRYIER